MSDLMKESFGSRFWTSFKSFWVGLWSVIKRTSPKVLGPVAALVIIVIAVVLVSMGFKELQIGGLLGRLLGKRGGTSPDSGKTVELANSVDPKRIDADGNLIPIGTPDTQGMTQAAVVPIKPPGLFSDPNKVVFTAPGDTKSTTVILPEGVKNNQVEQVVVVTPTVVAVTVKDSTQVSAARVDDLLRKYGK
jgi:hypothetical protein